MAGISSAEQLAERRRQALAYLERHTVMTLATYGIQGVWAAAVFYANQHFDLYFLSAGQTRHGQDLGLTRRAAATIQENYSDWPAIQGVQLEGDVDQLTGEERDLAIDLYQQKYPFLRAADRALQAQLAKINWYRLSPERLYFIDNSLGFGHRDEIDLYADGG
ncbi:MAG TPA: pyridoxamine 5'-phosphate oxidase family protein [Anaerolineae bacterium]|nr:pyridoxamine 5'-phosphate oxidase family protein [Anaerolineae bacterium]